MFVNISKQMEYFIVIIKCLFNTKNGASAISWIVTTWQNIALWAIVKCKREHCYLANKETSAKLFSAINSQMREKRDVVFSENGNESHNTYS